MKVEPGNWPWGTASLALTLAGLAWVLARRRGRPARSPRAWAVWLGRLGLFAIGWAMLLPTHGPLLTVDTARDLIQALGIARLGQHPSVGPAIPPLHSNLSPLWYYLLAPPMWVGRVWALVAFQVGWQALTTEALFAFVRRLFGSAAAAMACVGLMLSANVATTFDVLTHANLLFVVTVWCLHALLRAHVDEESEQIVPVIFWLSVAVQVHATAIVLWPVALAFALLRGRDARWDDTAVALLVGLAPFLPSMPTVPGVYDEPFGLLLYDVLDRSKAVVPGAIAVLLIARPRTLTRPRGLGLTALTLLAWAAWTFPLAHGERLGLLNLGVVLDAPRLTAAPVPTDVQRVWLSLVSVSGAPGWVAALSAALASALIAIGATKTVRAALRGDDQGTLLPRRSDAFLVCLWSSLTLAPGLAFVTLHDAWERYVAIGALSLIVLGAAGAAQLGSVVGARLPTRARLPVGATVPVGALAVAIACRHAAAPDTHPWRAEIAQAMADGVRALPGLDTDGVLRRVHATPDMLDSDKTSSTALLQAAALDGPLAHDAPDARHWRVWRPPSGPLAPGDVAFGGSGFVARPYAPTLRVQDITLAGRVHPRGQPDRDTLRLPFREEDALHYPSWVTPNLGIDAQPLLPGADGVTADLLIPRATTPPAFTGVVVLANGNLFESSARRDEPCGVEVWSADASLPATRLDDARVWFPLPPDPSPLRVRVTACSLRELDVFEAPEGG